MHQPACQTRMKVHHAAVNRMARTFLLAGCLAALLPLFPSQSPATTASKAAFALSDRVYLNPNTGRFWTVDSYEGNSEDPQSLHKYLYAQNNPVNGSDASGNDFDMDFSLGSALGSSVLDSFGFNFSIAQTLTPISLRSSVEVYSRPFDNYSHSFLKITPGNASLFPKVPMVANQDGTKFFTIGGFPGNGDQNLVEQKNERDDVSSIMRNSATDRGSITRGTQINGLISTILNSLSYYDNHQVWYGVMAGGHLYNCNSLTAGIILEEGAQGPSLDADKFVGFDNPVPKANFGK